MTDLVYITGGKSAWNHNELRYSLRSMEQHLSNLGQVFIVGEIPCFLHGVTFVPCSDMPQMKKEPRLFAKREIACSLPGLSDKALFAYDDEYLLQPHDADNFPYYYQGDLQTYLNRLNKEGHHKRCTRNTIEALTAKGYHTKLFDVHVPMLIFKTQFSEIMRGYNWAKKDGFLIKSTYANTLYSATGNAVEVRDTKINHPDCSLSTYKAMIEGKPFFSTGDNCNWPILEQLMKELYPKPSKYEI